MQAQRAIIAEAERIDHALSAERAARVAAYFELLQRWNHRVRLTGAPDQQTLIQRHLADGLLLAELLTGGHDPESTASKVPGRPSAVDVGAGGGLPGLLVALCCDGLDLTLVESNGRKSAFLRTAVHQLTLDNVTILNLRLEKLLASSGHPLFDIAWSRATFAPLSWLALAEQLVGPSGRIFAFAAAAADLPPAAGQLRREKLHRYHLADGTRRALARYARHPT